MLKKGFLACANVELWDVIVCFAVNREKFLKYYTIFKFPVHRSITF